MGKIKLTVFSDPGHAWLRVPRHLYDTSGVQASRYSYQSVNNVYVYLEEDCDAGLFIEAMRARNVETVQTVRTSNRSSSIRNYPRLQNRAVQS